MVVDFLWRTSCATGGGKRRPYIRFADSRFPIPDSCGSGGAAAWMAQSVASDGALMNVSLRAMTLAATPPLHSIR